MLIGDILYYITHLSWRRYSFLKIAKYSKPLKPLTKMKLHDMYGQYISYRSNFLESISLLFHFILSLKIVYHDEDWWCIYNEDCVETGFNFIDGQRSFNIFLIRHSVVVVVWMLLDSGINFTYNILIKLDHFNPLENPALIENSVENSLSSHLHFIQNHHKSFHPLRSCCLLDLVIR